VSWPQGLPNSGTIALLCLATAQKKKKRPFVKLQEEFPELPEKTKENPKFIIISSKDPKKNISEYSCFAVYRALNIISKEIVSISTLRDGILLMQKKEGKTYQYI